MTTRSLTKEEIIHLKNTREIEDMIRTPGWKIFENILRIHYTEKVRAVEKIGGSVDELVASNADKGALLTLRFVLEIPSAMINQSNMIKSITSPAEE